MQTNQNNQDVLYLLLQQKIEMVPNVSHKSEIYTIVSNSRINIVI